MLSPDKAELFSVLLEAIFYGFSLLMFGGTIWMLVSQRSILNVNRRIFTVAWLLLLISTAHIVINFIRLMSAFILYRDTYPGGIIAYLSDLSEWTYVYRHYAFTVQTLLGDSVALYRCYVVWQSKLVMILPALLWCATGVSGIGHAYIASREGQEQVISVILRITRWSLWFWASAFATNVLAILLLAGRIWYVDRKTTRLYGPGKSELRHLLSIIIDAGLIYTLSLLAAFVSYICHLDFEYGLITPIISITFYMVIVRVGLAHRGKETTDVPNIQLEYTATDSTHAMQVHIMSLTQRKFDQDYPSPSMTPIDSAKRCPTMAV